MTTRTTQRQRLGLVSLLTLIALSPLDEALAAPPPLVLKLDSPRRNSIQYDGQWPLRLTMRPRDDDDFEIVTNEQFPGGGDRTALLFEDIDGCLTLQDPSCPVDPTGQDETYLEFITDFDLPGRVDRHGFRRGQIDNPANRPVFQYGDVADDPASLRPIVLGPDQVGDPNDGIGYGPNDDLPGLVLLSNIGTGVVRTATPSFAGAVNPLVQTTPLRARNIAGLMTNVTYQLRATPRRTIVSTDWMVPRDFFAPVLYYDPCITEVPRPRFPTPGCDGRRGHRIEDGPLVISTRGPFVIDKFQGIFGPTPPDPRVIAPPNVVSVEIVAVVVQGDAPAIVDDCTGNGRIDSRDLECMGYRLISNQVKSSFTQAANFTVCGGGSFIEDYAFSLNAVLVDFDNNGVIPIQSCPPGEGRVAKPPK